MQQVYCRKKGNSQLMLEFCNGTTCTKQKLPDKFEDINGLHANYVSGCAHTLCLQQNSLGDGVDRAQAEAGQDRTTQPLGKHWSN